MQRPLLALALASVPAAAAAQPTVVPSVTFTSPYVFRGAVFSRGLTVQPAVELRRGAVFAGVFANVDPNGTASGRTVVLNEADAYAGVTTTVGKATLGATYTLYTFPTSTADGLTFAPSNEISVSARLDAPLAPGVLVAYDFDGDEAAGDLRGAYAELTAGHTARLAGVPLALGAAVGVDAGYLLPEGTLEPAFATVSAGTSLAAGQATFAPRLALQVSMARAYRQALAQPVLLYGGVTVGF